VTDSQPTFHIDRGQIFRSERTSEGFLNCHAKVARVGELRYLNADGSDRIERVTPEVLFNPDSYNSLKMKPVTCPSHPPMMLDSTNTKDHAKGMTSNIVTVDGSFLGVILTLTDKEAIDSVESGKTQEVSCGYMATTRLLPDGSFQQVSRDYNHLSIVPKGRAGSEVRISMDSQDLEVLIQEERTEITEQSVSINKDMETQIKTSSLKLDEFESIDLPLEHAQKIKAKFVADASDRAAIKKQLDELKAEYDALMSKYKALGEENEKVKKENTDAKIKCDRCDAIAKIINDRKFDSIDVLLAKFDAQAEKIETLEKSHTDANSIDIAALVKARVALERKCDGLLPAEFKVDSASDRQLMEAVITKNTKLTNCDGLSDDYIKARFDSVLEAHENRDTSEIARIAANESGTRSNPNTDSLSDIEKLRLDAANAQKEMIANLTKRS
jgi:uncharacterized protein